MSDKIREAFERWYMESRGLPYPCDGTELHRDEEGGYHFRDPADAWRTWQAALAQQCAEVERYRTMSDNYSSLLMDANLELQRLRGVLKHLIEDKVTSHENSETDIPG